MADGRMLKTAIFSNADFVELTNDAKLLFIASINLADDDGRLTWNARDLYVRAFARDPRFTASDVARWMDEIESINLIRAYTVNDIRYALHPNWHAHQKLSHPSQPRHPNPDGVYENTPENASKRNKSPDKSVLRRRAPESAGERRTPPGNRIEENRKEETTDVVPEGSHTHTGTHEDAPEGGSNLGLPLGTSLDPSEPLAPTPEPPKPPAPTGKKSQKTRPEISERDLAAYAITEAMVKLVAPHLGKAMTQAEWRKRNNDAARKLVDAGSTPGDVCAAFEVQAERGFAYANLSLAKLQETMIRDSAKASAPTLTLVPELERGFCYNQPATRRKGQFVEGWDPWGPDGVPREKILAWLDDGIDLGKWPIHPMVRDGLVAA